MSKELYTIKLINNPLGFNLALGSIVLLKKNASILQQVVRTLQVKKHGLLYPLIWAIELLSKTLQHKNIKRALRRHDFEGEVYAVVLDSIKYDNRYSNYVNANCVIVYQGGALSGINEFATLGHLSAEISDKELEAAIALSDKEQ
jgi:hypothetical protein